MVYCKCCTCISSEQQTKLKSIGMPEFSVGFITMNMNKTGEVGSLTAHVAG
jgi:hypothetical protein